MPVSVDGRPYTLVPGAADCTGHATATATYAADSGHTLAFRSVATDAVGNAEVKASGQDASTYVPDFDPPTTAVTTVDASKPAFVVPPAGPGGRRPGLSPGPGRLLGDRRRQVARLSLHTVGTDRAGDVELAPAVGDVTASARFDVPPPLLQATGLTVQGRAVGRSFVRYIDVNFNQTVAALQALIAGNKVHLVKYDLNPSTIGDAALSAIDHAIEVDNGVGGNAGTTDCDSYYEIAVDLAAGTRRLHFDRLLGEMDGSRVVDNADITNALGQNEPNLLPLLGSV